MAKAPKIILRAVEEADLPFFYRFQQEPDGHLMAVVKPRDEEAFYQHWRANVLSHPDVIVRTIEVDGAIAGDINSFILEGHLAVGYWLGQRYWGQGIASAAVAEFVTKHDPRRPLYAFVATTNGASYRVLEKCGFRQVGGTAKASDGIDEFKLELV